MKTIKIIFSILGVSLATLSFGQHLSPRESQEESQLNLSKFLDKDSELLFYTAEYNEENGQVTHWVHILPESNPGEVSTRTNKPSTLSRTYFAKDIEVLYESIPVVEEWMTIPFEESFIEPMLNIEPWMCAPFETATEEKELEVESWMTKAWI